MPRSKSVKLFNGLLPAPSTALPTLPLSIKASTHSCNILFSFLTMISGALSACNFFNLLFLLITRRYKSLRSLVAKRPPSNCTNGLKSGGITGSTLKIIDCGLESLFLKSSTTCKRLINFLFFWPVVSAICSLKESANKSKSNFLINARTPSAPMPDSNFSSYLRQIFC